jgi:hypothetical protein
VFGTIYDLIATHHNLKLVTLAYLSQFPPNVVHNEVLSGVELALWSYDPDTDLVTGSACLA